MLDYDEMMDDLMIKGEDSLYSEMGKRLLGKDKYNKMIGKANENDNPPDRCSDKTES